jgi:hypothetical protein
MHLFDQLIFQGLPLGALPHTPRILIAAFDLISGREIVFGRGVAAPLDAAGTHDLLSNYPDINDKYKHPGLPLSKVVAAATAYLPWFSPVRISKRHEILIDAGFIDNLAINAPLASLSLARSWKEWSPVCQWENRVNVMIVLDGGAKPFPPRYWPLPRSQAVLRLLKVMTGAHRQTLDWLGALAEHVFGQETYFLGLWQGPPDSFAFGQELRYCVSNVRTHLDSFSTHESSIIAFCGYARMQTLIDSSTRLRNHSSGQTPTPMQYSQFSELFGAPKIATALLVRHLWFSGWHISLLRNIGRLIASLVWRDATSIRNHTKEKMNTARRNKWNL